ncbi:PP2C family protein-serine/threonine phosphatase [Leptospira sp. 96542]|nr:PP2C family protein-serine/threonine phosphatase [Leptospira sp. 96542]
MYLKILQQIRILLDLHPDRKRFKLEYKKELNRQARMMQIPGSIIGIFAWLGFAFKTDPKLHPEFPELFYFRIGLSLLCFFLFILIVYSRIFRSEFFAKGLIWSYLVFGYVLFVTAFFTGRIAYDTAYVSGFQMVIMILPFIPFPRTAILFFYPTSILIFIFSIWIYAPNLDSVEVSYSMQNLAISYGLGTFSAFVIERFRFRTFLSHKRIFKKNSQVNKVISETRELKNKQDGDYFLTSLLFNPLLGKETESNNIKIESVLNQFKKFQFRNKEYQLGGDYVSVYNLILQGKRYKAFINGDAMGKSIQGAGGAIVLGAVYNSIIIRSKMDPSSSNRSPERWLHDCYLDLQKVFETFDGAMLVSAVIGLLEESTGTLYFINLEHPWLVLYKNGQAKFIENNIYYYKLGVMETNSETFVSVFQMEKGDKVFCGSDGKDDLVLSETGNSRIINEDQDLFLRQIEAVNGNTKQLVDALRNVGKFSDDLSLLSLEYTTEPNPPVGGHFLKAKKLFSQKNYDDALYLLLSYGSATDISVPELKLITKLYEKKDDILKAMEFASLALENLPSDTNWIFHTSVLYKRMFSVYKSLSFLLESRELAERVRLRQPSNIRNLIHLADVCRLSGDKDRFTYILKQIQKLEPNNPRLKALKDKT